MKKIMNNALFALLASASVVVSANGMDAHLAESVIAEKAAMEAAVASAAFETKTYFEQAKELANTVLTQTKNGIVTMPTKVNDFAISAKNHIQSAGSSVSRAVITGTKNASDFLASTLDQAQEGAKVLTTSVNAHAQSAATFAKNAYHSGLEQANNNKALVASGAAGVTAGLVYKLGLVGKATNGVKATYNYVKNHPKTAAVLATVAAVPSVYAAVTHKAVLAENLE
ncbi:MAG: hypothetical protein M1114_02345, partial [Candidatus Dependentiae bacterium]|nr:hypothetical protein [Candidatus Dependentiae bacterium]